MARSRLPVRRRTAPASVARGDAAGGGFAGIVAQEMARRSVSPGSSPGESLARLPYELELGIKHAALASFWREARIEGSPKPIVPSPRPRGYRTNSKRRVALLGRSAHLFLGDRKVRRDGPRFVPSPLEPETHAALYRFLQAKLSEPPFHLVARHLGWLIVRGSYEDRAVIFNVDGLFGALVRKLKILAGHLAADDPPVSAAFVYVDDTGSDYYLEARRPKQGVVFKKLFGPDLVRVRYGDLAVGFPPTSFCQVNESIVPEMLRVAGEMLAPRTDDRLLDLYCGTGLFALAFADRVREAVGLDVEGPSIEAARANARALRRGRTRFLAGAVTEESVARLAGADAAEIVVLDPPRSGTERGVIAAVAARRPRAVVHVFCNVDEIPRSLREWTAGGYGVRGVAPLDMFPGTPGLEVLIHLEAARDPAMRR